MHNSAIGNAACLATCKQSFIFLYHYSHSIRSLKDATTASEEENDHETNNPVQRLPSLTQTGSVDNLEVGLPLRLFGRGNLCHPYLSLSYIDTLSQPCVRGYIIGATNALFKQKQVGDHFF